MSFTTERAEDMVSHAIEAAAMMNPAVRKLDGLNVLVQADNDKQQVAVLSGGGSGHEPSHAGWVGKGMLTAAVAGSVFASPSTAEVLSAILHVTGDAGCLLIIKNYTGDRLNFGIACEQAKACGKKVEMVIVGDDCALPDRSSGIVGRRGLAGTCFVHKVAGAAAAAGQNLSEVAAVAREAASAIGTLGVAVRTCKLPGQPREDRIPVGEMEVGLGIHGEAGACVAPLASAAQTVEQLLSLITSQDSGRSYLNLAEGDSVALMLNNLGGISSLEMAALTRAAVLSLRSEYRVQVTRCFSGTFMSALDMSGFSVTLFKLTPKLLALLDAAAAPLAWPAAAAVSTTTTTAAPPLPPGTLLTQVPSPPEGAQALLTSEQQEVLRKAIIAGAQKICELEPQLTLWDTKAGDGDCGQTLRAGATAILDDLSAYPLGFPSLTLRALGYSLGRAMGGTSGVVYQVFLTAAATKLVQVAPDASPTISHVADAFQAGADAISTYGGARLGDRTMLDALLPAATAMAKAAPAASMASAVAAAAAAAQDGAERTKQMAASAGRSSYVPREVLEDVPDPGAMAVAAWLSAASDAAR